MDMSADRMNSIGFIKTEIQDLQQECRKLSQEIGNLWELVRKQDQEIERLKQLNGSDGK